MNADEYQQFREACLVEMNAKMGRLPELLLLQPAFDAPAQKLHFLSGDDAFLEADASLIGSLALQSGSWRWAWANDSVPQALREESRKLKALARTTGDAAYSNADAFQVDQPTAMTFMAVACRECQAEAVYNLAPDDTLRLWFVLTNLRWLKDRGALIEAATHAARDALFAQGGVGAFNALRNAFEAMRLDLIGVDFRGTPQPWAHDLHVQTLVDYGYLDPRQARDLAGVNLAHTRLDNAVMRGVGLQSAVFDGASLIDVDFTGADLRGASLRGAFLNGANFTRAKVGGADVAGAELGRTLLTDVDLSEVKGLDQVHHTAPSEISMNTLIASRFQLTPTFLKQAGVSRGLIEDLVRGQRLSGRYQTCFLSYSSTDRVFASHLYDSLGKAGVRVFWDQFDVIPGEYLDDQIVQAIREHDRLIIVLSPASMASSWVKREIELAWYHKRESLILVRLCPIEEIRAWTAAHETLPDLATLFPVLDLSGWTEPDEFTRALTLILKTLAGGADIRPPAPAQDQT
jgi:uncharacterized protein YjbI with pentapeptide repeats